MPIQHDFQKLTKAADAFDQIDRLQRTQARIAELKKAGGIDQRVWDSYPADLQTKLLHADVHPFEPTFEQLSAEAEAAGSRIWSPWEILALSGPQDFRGPSVPGGCAADLWSSRARKALQAEFNSARQEGRVSEAPDGSFSPLEMTADQKTALRIKAAAFLQKINMHAHAEPLIRLARGESVVVPADIVRWSKSTNPEERVRAIVEAQRFPRALAEDAPEVRKAVEAIANSDKENPAVRSRAFAALSTLAAAPEAPAPSIREGA
jgi:hypothetical protein